jgi:hypothetical protein
VKENFVMPFLTLRAYAYLILFELYLVRRNFAALYSKVRDQKIGRTVDIPQVVETVCTAVDVACIWYWKEVLCLQRSATTTYLLKRYGIQAEMIIGAQQMPVKAHAWVEVDGRVVNDKPYMRKIYAVLDRSQEQHGSALEGLEP